MRWSSVVMHSTRFSPLDAVSWRLDPRYSNSTSIASTFFFVLLESDHSQRAKEWLLNNNRGMSEVRMRRNARWHLHAQNCHVSVNKSIPFGVWC